MSNILSLLSQYEILARTAQYLSALDIFRRGLTNFEFHAIILRSEPILNRLRHTTLCDGTGLKARQNFEGLYAAYAKRRGDGFYEKGCWRQPQFDEELEVRVWNLKCDEVNALPCIKCGTNVCEVGSPK
jgi:hypothetical protein